MSILDTKFVSYNDDERNALEHALSSSSLSGTSESVTEFESYLSRYFNRKYAITCASGTAGLHLALLALDIQPGKSIAVPPTAAVMSALPILAIQRSIYFVDIEHRSTFGIDINQLRLSASALAAVISVPMWGYPHQMDSLCQFCDETGIPLIEDFSQAHGTTVKNRLMGTFGAIAIASTHDRKLIATGEGGFILTDSDVLADRLRSIRLFGKILRSDGEYSEKTGKFGFRFGLNFKISGLAAAIGPPQLLKLHDKIRRREAIACKIRPAIDKCKKLQELSSHNGAPNYYAIVLQTKPQYGPLNREILQEVLNTYLIASDVISYDYRPLYELPIFESFYVNCPNALDLSSSIFTLPCHEGLTDEDVGRIISCLEEVDQRCV